MSSLYLNYDKKSFVFFYSAIFFFWKMYINDVCDEFYNYLPQITVRAAG